MKKSLHPLSLLSLFFILILATLAIQYANRNGDTGEIRSKATEKNISVKSLDSIASIQQAINSAGNGNTITIAGTYSGADATLIGSSGGTDLSTLRGTAQYCFLRIEGKNITLQGNGAVLFGEGHDKPYQDPYQNRAGICVINGGVTLNGIRVKEFQKRCLVVYNSAVVVHNSVIEGCDEGGVSMLGNSSGLFVNNFFVATSAVMMWQNSFAKLINNTIYSSNIIFFLHPDSNDSARVEAVNNIITNEDKTVWQVDWWPSEVGKMSNSRFGYNLIWKNGKACDPTLEYCTDYTGKIVEDPMFIDPVIDQRGMAAWANFGLKEGSPAINAADPSIPGPRNLGNSGGPCTDPNSSLCQSYLQTNSPSVQIPPTLPPVPPTNPAQPTEPGVYISATPNPNHPQPTDPNNPYYPPPSFPWPTSVPGTGVQPTSPGGYVIPTYSQPSGTYNPPGTNPGGGYQPSISYYLPPTVAYGNQQVGNNNTANQPTGDNTQFPGTTNNPNNPSGGNTQFPGATINPNNPANSTPGVIPTVKPTPKPLIDIKKTIETTKRNINNIIQTIKRLSQIILP